MASPTVALNSPTDGSSGYSTTPELKFTGTDTMVIVNNRAKVSWTRGLQ